jgi:hypothetical protein
MEVLAVIMGFGIVLVMATAFLVWLKWITGYMSKKEN